MTELDTLRAECEDWMEIRLYFTGPLLGDADALLRGIVSLLPPGTVVDAPYIGPAR